MSLASAEVVDASWADARVLIAGLGKSGAAAAVALAERGAAVRVVDARGGESLRALAETLAIRGVQVELEADFADLALLDGCTLLMPSPGVGEWTPLLGGARARQVPIWSEPELAWRLAPAGTRLVTVTGTNGKTTTTELLAGLLRAPTAGNIGTPLTSVLAGAHPPPLVVVELSSFQLRFTHTLGADVTVLLNVAPDHLDWHRDYDEYVAAKAQAWARPKGPRVLVLGDDEGARQALAAHPFDGEVRRVRHGAPTSQGEVGILDGHLVVQRADGPLEIIAIAGLGLTGAHNVANACAAVAAAVAIGAPAETLAAPLRAFRPGPHRQQLVAERAGVAWINDSKATNPHAAAASLRACGAEGTPLIWIAGGLAKGLDFDTLRESVATHVRHALTIGSGGPTLAELARHEGVEVTEAGTLAVAVRRAADLARPGDTVLLAPACASMDQFVDYAARGDAFAAAVAALHHPGGEGE